MLGALAKGFVPHLDDGEDRFHLAAIHEIPPWLGGVVRLPTSNRGANDEGEQLQARSRCGRRASQSATPLDRTLAPGACRAV